MQTANLTKSLIPWATEATQPPRTQAADDLDLIRRLKAADDDAVRHLYGRYGQRLYAYALRLTNDPATAEDVTQNALITAWHGSAFLVLKSYLKENSRHHWRELSPLAWT